jgi:hypothetical protein
VGSSVVDVGPRLAVALVALTALAAAGGRLSGLGQDRPIVVAAVRATVQESHRLPAAPGQRGDAQ